MFPISFKVSQKYHENDLKNMHGYLKRRKRSWQSWKGDDFFEQSSRYKGKKISCKEFELIVSLKFQFHNKV